MASPPFNLSGKWKRLIPGDVAIVMVEQENPPSDEGRCYRDVPAESTPATGSQELVFLTDCTEHPQLLLLLQLQALQLKSRFSNTKTTNRREWDLKRQRADKGILVRSSQGHQRDAPPGWGTWIGAVASRREHLQRHTLARGDVSVQKKVPTD